MGSTVVSLGLWLCRSASATSTARRLAVPVSPRVGLAALMAFFPLLVGLRVPRDLGNSQSIALFEAFSWQLESHRRQGTCKIR
jgi:hypothetical protein